MYTNLQSNYIVVTLNNSDTDLSKIFIIMCLNYLILFINDLFYVSCRFFLFQAYQLLAFYELTINA